MENMNMWEKTQAEWIRNILLAYKPNDQMKDNLWGRVSDMVGFFNAEEGRTQHEQMIRGVECAMGPLIPGLDPHAAGARPPPESPVKGVVCSPDLPVFSLTQAFEEAAVESSPFSSPEKSFQCGFCSKNFAQKNTYQNHLRSHGKEGEDPYQCNMCGKTFAVPARLTRHYRTHTGEKPYQCEYCNKSFSVKENLSVHRRIHTKERPYKCDICERAFEHSGKLHRHMRIHTGERPHKCNVCNKTFIQSGQLVIHTRTHTGEKPYVCKVCNKGFTCSKQLKVHTRTHTGEKPYTCDICGKSFGYNHVLKLHQVAHYGEKVYKCTICNETFTSKKTMESHIKSHSESPNASVVTVVIRSPPRNGQTTDLGESSCASSTSDKENKADSDSELPRVPPLVAETTPPTLVSFNTPTQPAPHQAHPNMRELCYYLYPRATSPTSAYKQNPRTSGVNTLLAAAAAAAASEGRSDSPLPRHEEQEPEMRRGMSQCSPNSSPMSIDERPLAEPSIYVCPEPLGSMKRRSSPYHFQLPPSEYLEPPILINLPSYSSSSRRRWQAPEEQPAVVPESPTHFLTPPHSNPVSPVPSLSPDPIDLATVPRTPISLPPRKRSKSILKAMETAAEESATIRHSSVIHYAKAS